jgi:hypothetical protein
VHRFDELDELVAVAGEPLDRLVRRLAADAELEVVAVLGRQRVGHEQRASVAFDPKECVEGLVVGHRREHGSRQPSGKRELRLHHDIHVTLPLLGARGQHTRLRASHLAHPVQRVTAEVHGSAARGLVTVPQIGLVLDGDLEHPIHVPERAELPRTHDVEHAQKQRVVAVVESFDEQAPGLLGDLDHALRFQRVRRERFLAEHVLAGSQRRDRPLRVKVHGQRVINGVDVWIGDHVRVALRHAGDAVLTGILRGPFGVASGHDIHRRLRALLRWLNQPAWGNLGSSEDSETQGAGHAPVW